MRDLETSNEPTVGTSAGAVHVQGNIKRTLLQKSEFPNGYVINTSIIEVPAGTSASPHTHPGIETGYVIGGEFYLCVEGLPDQHHVIGSSYTVPADAVHYARVPGPDPLKVLCVFVVNDTMPLATVERAAP
ncbi:cupin domain-containing protein [Amycolatopsis sp. NPDC051071]|uniref:cupin domain-containing protein n=1 Tax=Amycolatopsis sp. NPDC051071 TaxID=3154637 RepID=UPI00342D95F4